MLDRKYILDHVDEVLTRIERVDQLRVLEVHAGVEHGDGDGRIASAVQVRFGKADRLPRGDPGAPPNIPCGSLPAARLVNAVALQSTSTMISVSSARPPR